MPDLAPETRAVDRRGLVEIGVHRHERRKVDDHRGAGVGPGRLEDERRHGGARRLEPRVRAQADPAEDRVKDAVRAGVVERLPQEDRHHRGNHDRQVGERAVQPSAPSGLAHQHGYREGEWVAEEQRSAAK